MTTTTYDVDAHINMRLLSREGDGDADINSQSGRMTRVSVGWTLTRNNTAQQDGFDVTYWCRIEEVHKDYTTISNGWDNKVISVRCDPNVEIVHVNAGGPTHSALDTNWSNSHGFSRVVRGKKHDWVNWTNEDFARNAGFIRFFIKVDGPGRDDRGNCAIDATLRIPITTRPRPSAAPFSFRSSRDIFKVEASRAFLDVIGSGSSRKMPYAIRKSARQRAG